MAVSKIWKVTVRLAQVIDYATNPEKTVAKKFTPEQYQALADVLQYAKNEEKTEREFYVDGINCNASTARDQFVTVKEQFGKPDGIQAYHGYLSFKEEDISPELAQKIGMEFANRVWGKRFQVVVTTHLNTKHLHCHFVVNSVSFVDGKRLANEEKAWFKFRHIADELCQQYKLYYDPNPVRGNSNSYYYQLRKAGMPDRYDRTRSAIDDAISKSRTLKEFEYVLDQMGYKYQLSESLKYWTVVPKGWKKPIRLYRLGEDYTNDRIKERIKGNRDKVYLEPYQKQTYKPRQYRLATREHRIKRRAVCTVCIFTIATNSAICQTTKSRTLLDCIIFSEKICIRSISYLHKSGCSVEKTSQLLSNFSYISQRLWEKSKHLLPTEHISETKYEK